MKKFLFSLERVLNFKQQTLDVKKNELAVLQQKLQVIEKQIEEFDSKYSAESKKMADEMQKGMTANTVLIYKTYLSGLNDQTQKLKKSQKQQRNFIDQKMREVVAIKTEISGLEKLKEQQWIAYCKEAQKLQELAIEEFISQTRSRV